MFVSEQEFSTRLFNLVFNFSARELLVKVDSSFYYFTHF